jgi:hypothetical protein
VDAVTPSHVVAAVASLALIGVIVFGWRLL